MSKIRVMLEVDSAAMNEVLTTPEQREQLGEALVNAVWAKAQSFSNSMTLAFYGIKVVSYQAIDDSVAIVPPQPRGWLVIAAMRDWLKST